jgi:hypothetical protein
MENPETPTRRSSTSKKSNLSQPRVSLPDLQTECIKEPLLGEKEKSTKKQENNLEIEEKDAPFAPREPASDFNLGQRVLAIRKAESMRTVEILPSDFNTLE